jgi:phosphohistidine phosphatase SixA
MRPLPRRCLAALPLALALARPPPARAAAVTAEVPAGQALVARLRAGGLVLFFRHADTVGEPCDRSDRVGDRAGQRNLSAAGRAQAVRLGQRLAALGIPIADPVLAGPVFRARDTADLAFGPGRVRVTDDLLADDYAGARLEQVLAGHRRLLSEPPPAGANRVLVGHRTPAIMVVGPAVGGAAFPEGAALVIAPAGAGAFAPAGAGAFAPAGAGAFAPEGAGALAPPGAGAFTLLGILALAPTGGSGFHACQ